MTTNTETTDWPAAWAHLRTLDGDVWDDESDRLDALWCAEYKAAFVAHAMTRNWKREDAEVWASEIADEALNEARGDDATPTTVAQNDVFECEQESANA